MEMFRAVWLQQAKIWKGQKARPDPNLRDPNLRP